MCISCNETSQIFSVEIVTQEPVSSNMDLYKEIAQRLFQNKVISLINVGNNRAYIANDKQIFGFELHLTNRHNPCGRSFSKAAASPYGIPRTSPSVDFPFRQLNK